jgi:hypothetical protein
MLMAMTLMLSLACAWIPQYANEDAKLLPQDGAAHDEFGYAVGLSGNRALVTAVYDDDLGDSSGSAYIFERGAGDWVQVAKLHASDGGSADNFGRAAALYGDRALVAGNYAGVYVFERDAGGSWNEVQKLQPNGGFFYGWVSLSVWDEWALVGDSAQDSRGTAYVFRRNAGGHWDQVRRLSASDAVFDDRFGEAVAFTDVPRPRALIGAPHKHFGYGGVYLYEETSPGVWDERIFQVDDRTSHLALGCSVSISGDRALAAAVFAKKGVLASVFEPDFTGQWMEIAELLTTDGAEEGDTTQSVSLWGERALVGSRHERAAYVFRRTPEGTWVQTAKLMPSDATYDYTGFGQPPSLGSGAALIGALFHDEQGEEAGAAYVFDLFVGTKYCNSTINSTGHQANLLGTGTSSLEANDLVLTAGPVPDEFGVLCVGTTRVEKPFGNGVLCVGPRAERLAPIHAHSGEFVQAVDFDAPPLHDSLLPGQAWYFQLWFRDPAAGGAFFNLTNALAITIEP